MAATACGVRAGDAQPDNGDTSSAATTPTPATTPVQAPPGDVGRLDEPATATTPAERVDDGLRVTWIGGSEIDLDDRSLPNAVAALNPIAGDRPLQIFADTKIAPLPDEIEQRVEQAAERNMDGLVVILNPSWLSWDGHTECSGIVAPHDFYACVLTPRPETDVAALRSEVEDLIETIVATGLPAYVYVIPHSAESLANTELAALLAATEAQFAAMNPRLERIEYVDHIISRDLAPLREGIEFNDMVHPSAIGIQDLADFFSGEFARFFDEAVTT